MSKLASPSFKNSAPAFDVKIPADSWEETGPEDDPKCRLLCTGVINGHHFHVEAYQVKNVDIVQTIANDYFDDEWEGICRLNTESAFCTMKIGRRVYVVIMQPFGD